MKIPKEIKNWLKSHKGHRKPVHADGFFNNYAYSRTSACWGQPQGGFIIGEYKIAICQPSTTAGGIPVMFYDFIKV